MSYFLTPAPDFARHNAEVQSVWEAYRAGRPYRVPVTVTGSIRVYLQNPDLNDTGYTFEDFFTNPEAQIRCQLEYQKWQRYNLLCDREMGPPPEWQLAVDFQNSYEATWFGAPLVLQGNHVPDTREILKQDRGRLYDMSCPDVSSGLVGRAMEFAEYMQERCRDLEFEGAPVKPPQSVPGEGTDGPLDAAYKLRGAAEVCMDMLTDPDYYHDLMTFVTDCSLKRMKALREWRWERNPEAPDAGQYRQPNWGFADDAIAMLSVEQYREFVLPYHQRLQDEFWTGEGNMFIHLCGNAWRFFPLLREELGATTFDTGFPIDFGQVREQLGPEVEIFGGPTIMLLREGPEEKIRAEVKRICGTGIMQGGKFVLREANNLAPLTPVEHIETFYEAAQQFGRY
jgi:hypothetical protein